MFLEQQQQLAGLKLVDKDGNEVKSINSAIKIKPRKGLLFDKYLMNLKELDSFRISDAISFHDKLNPKLWNNTKLRPEVKQQLLIIAEDFLEELGITWIRCSRHDCIWF
jgi:hypothetical protein